MEEDQGLELVIEGQLQWAVPSGLKHVCRFESLVNRGKQPLECPWFSPLFQSLEGSHVVTPVKSSSYEKRPGDFYSMSSKKCGNTPFFQHFYILKEPCKDLTGQRWIFLKFPRPRGSKIPGRGFTQKRRIKLKPRIIDLSGCEDALDLLINFPIGRLRTLSYNV
jgi:hypothetical protein